MGIENLEKIINQAWDNKDNISTNTIGEVKDSILDTLDLLGTGKLRVAEPIEENKWKVNQWAKKAVLLSFRLKDMTLQPGGPQNTNWWITNF